MQSVNLVPLLVMFGLDYTIWPYHAHHSVAPHIKNSTGIYDDEGRKMTLFPEVPQVFQKLHKQGIKIAVGTIGLDAKLTQRLLELFDLEKYISYKQLWLVNYEVMVERIRNESRIEFIDMLFFDDYDYNTELMRGIGVPSVHIKNGIDLKQLNDGLKQYHDFRLKMQKEGS